MRIAVVGWKGGTGKTTTAVALAAAAHASGRRTLLRDLDPQQSASRWASAANAGWTTLDVIGGQPDEDVTFFDLPAASSPMPKMALDRADLAVIPVAPTGADVTTLPWTLSLVRASAALPVILITRARARTRALAELRAGLAGLEGVAVFDTVIPLRQSVADASAGQPWTARLLAESGYAAVWDEICAAFPTHQGRPLRGLPAPTNPNGGKP